MAEVFSRQNGSDLRHKPQNKGEYRAKKIFALRPRIRVSFRGGGRLSVK